jgi:hypothetical protein
MRPIPTEASTEDIYKQVYDDISQWLCCFYYQDHWCKEEPDVHTYEDMLENVKNTLVLAKKEFADFDINHKFSSENHNWLIRADYLIDMDKDIRYKTLLKSLGAT